MKHEIRKMKLEDLKEAPYNPRMITKDALDGLKSSIKEFGLVQLPIWNKRTGHIVGGHQRKKSAVELGLDEVDVVVVDLPIEKEKALNVALNSPTISGEFTQDLQVLLNEIESENNELFDSLLFDDLRVDFEVPSFDLEEYFEDDSEEEEEVDEEDFAVTQPLDLWILGKHRIMCGDITKLEHLSKLFGKARAKLAFNPQPYSENREQDPSADLVLLKKEEFVEWFKTMTSNINEYMLPEGIWMGSAFIGSDRIEGVQRGKINIDSAVESTAKFTNSKSDMMASFYVNTFSKVGDIVFDPFGGLGLTLTACEQAKRKAYIMEISPKYCDIMVRKWQALTGKKAYLKESKDTFEKAALKRKV